MSERSPVPMEKCVTCGNVREYPFCLDKFHDTKPPNPMLDAINAVQNVLGDLPF